jgi:hypothetical protein
MASPVLNVARGPIIERLNHEPRACSRDPFFSRDGRGGRASCYGPRLEFCVRQVAGSSSRSYVAPGAKTFRSNLQKLDLVEPLASRVTCGSKQPQGPFPPAAGAPGKPWTCWYPGHRRCGVAFPDIGLQQYPRLQQPVAPGSFPSKAASQAVRAPRCSASQRTSLPKYPSKSLCAPSPIAATTANHKI